MMALEPFRELDQPDRRPSRTDIPTQDGSLANSEEPRGIASERRGSSTSDVRREES